jgi:hypothetical protein
MKYSIVPVCGLGNIVISLAGFYHIVKRAGLDPLRDTIIFNWIDTPFEDRKLFGGHPRRFRHLGHIFPRIGYHYIDKSLKDRDVNFTLYFCDDIYRGNDLKTITNTTSDPSTDYTVIMSWMSPSQYRFNYREEIIKWLEFGPSIKSEVDMYFKNNKITPSNTISLHSRMGSVADFMGMDTISVDHFTKAMTYLKSIYPNLDTVMVCSENQKRFEEHLSPEIINRLGFRYFFYDDNAENCIYAMCECAHHILSNSTMSYSVMYLDKKFPSNSLSIGNKFDDMNMHSDVYNPSQIPKKTGLIYFKDLV